MARDAIAGHRTPRWFDANGASTPQTSTLVAGLSLSIFMFAIESERLPALVNVGSSSSEVALISLLPFVVLGACVIYLCLRPVRRTAPLGWAVLAAAVCSLSLVSKYGLANGILPDALQSLWQIPHTLATPALLFFWVQRAMPLGRTFVTQSFGVGAIVLGCLTMLTMAFERSVALVLVIVLPFVGVALLPFIEKPREGGLGEPADTRWNALRAIAQGRPEPAAERRPRGGATVGLAVLRLVPFLCYAVIFGNVHFSWVDLQDGGTVSMWVQLGASTGSMLCGVAALALARLHWGHALESIMHLLLATFALVALWLSTFLTSGYVFAYLVLLNIAQKLTFLLMLLFGFSPSRNASECTSLWALVYFSFYAGTNVSYLVGTLAPTALNVAAAIAMVVVFFADFTDIVLLYGNGAAHDEGETRAVGGAQGDGGAVAESLPVSAPSSSQETMPVAEADLQGNPGASGPNTLAYTCHLIACQHDLTRREEEVLQLLARGRSAARISEALCISVATARTHQRNIYAKLGVHTQQDILDLFEQHGVTAEEG